MREIQVKLSIDFNGVWNCETSGQGSSYHGSGTSAEEAFGRMMNSIRSDALYQKIREEWKKS